MTDERPESTPTVIGRYRVLRTLGEGGMGAVYLATDPAIDRLVALKLMRAGFNTGSLRERFAREARAVGRLHHPNIVTIFEFGEHEGEPFIAMEYVEGQTLASLVGHADVTLGQQLALMDGLCAGLHYAHRAGIIHRDVKPVNVMVDAEGIVKILDFGIARAAALSLTQAGTQPGTILGTLNYMAPEQLAGKPVDQRADIYAVGAVFYELLTGRQAFPGNIDSGILQVILLTGPTPIAEVRPDLDPGVVAIVNRCLERDADKRYPDLGIMRRELAAIERAEAGPRSAGATVVLTPGSLPGSFTPAPLATPGPDTRDAAAVARRAELDRQVTEARAALDREEYTRASEACQQVLQAEPTHAGALALQAQLSAVQTARAWLADGQSQLDRGALTTAASLVDRALGVRPAMPEALKLRAAIEEARVRQQTSSSAPTVLMTPTDGARTTDATIVRRSSDEATILRQPNDDATIVRAAPVAPVPAPQAAVPASAPVEAARVQPAEVKRGVGRWVVAVLGVAALIAVGTFVVRRSTPPATSPTSGAAGAAAAPPPAPAPTAPPIATPPIVVPPPAPATASVPAAATQPPAAQSTSEPAPPPKTKSPTPTPASPPAPVPAPVVSPAAPPAIATGATPPDRSAASTAPAIPPTGGRGLRGAQNATGSTSLMPTAAAERACRNGNAHACTEAGLSYRNGRGVIRNETTAASYYERGCDGSDPFGCVDLGQLYFQGAGVARDDSKAAALYQKGCDGGVAAGCLFLGGMYQTGRSLPRDEPRAFGLFVKACDGNNVAACNEAAMMMEPGRGGARDDARAFQFLKKSCDGNFLLGCRNLGVRYEEGRGVPRNDQLALQAFQKACSGALGVACTNIGDMFAEGRGVPKSDAEAKVFYGKACDAGDQNGCRLKGGG